MMKDPIQFLRNMAAYYATTPVPEQETFVRRFEQTIGNNTVDLIEADGGIGKTLGYLVCGMREAHRKDLPLLIATSTVTNRDQIKHEYDKIIETARSTGDPIANIPLFNYRSARDYASGPRLDQIIDRLKQVKTPAYVLKELYDSRNRLESSPDALLDYVMPYDIVHGEFEVLRQEIAAYSSADLPEAVVDARKEILEHAEHACVVVMTHAMIASHPLFKKWIGTGKVAAVIIDEADKLTTMDYVAYTSLKPKNIANVLKRSMRNGVDIEAASLALDRLQVVIDAIKSTTNKNKHAMLIYGKGVGEELTKNTHEAIMNAAQTLYDLSEVIAERDGDNLGTEMEFRRLLFDIEELIIAADRLCGYIFPQGRDEWMINTTDLEVFFSWDEDQDELRVVTARPGGLMEWLFRQKITVPRLLTTAFLGESEKWFSNKIGLPITRLRREGAIRAQKYGSAKYVYFTGLHEAIWANPQTGTREPNPEHFDDMERMLRLSPWAWEPGKRILVLSPGYEDIKQIHARLTQNGSNAPIFPHLSGFNINEIRDKLIQSEEGGILLTVYWEGFNIVGTDNDRRSLIDVLVMSRIPYQRPNLMLETLHEHLGKNRNLVRVDLLNEAKRRIHQGFNRLIRGPTDQGVVLICDNRFPPPDVLIARHDEISPRREHMGLIEAIPQRFRDKENCFELVDAETWEIIE